jgi:hypothetical protein
VAIGCFGGSTLIGAAIGGFTLMDSASSRPTEVFLNQVQVWLGLASIPVAVVLLVAGAVWAARRDASGIHRKRRERKDS